jgi:hypothetical protein
MRAVADAVRNLLITSRTRLESHNSSLLFKKMRLIYLELPGLTRWSQAGKRRMAQRAGQSSASGIFKRRIRRI